MTIGMTGVYNVTVGAHMKAIDAWLRKTGVNAGRLGLLACGNARAVERIRNGTARVETLNSVLKYIKAHPAKRTRAASTS